MARAVSVRGFRSPRSNHVNTVSARGAGPQVGFRVDWARMHRALKVADYWNWLPVFRAVAETSSLRESAARLHVSASSISRTIRLLEEALGYSVFERTGGTLSLNGEGRRILESVRAAMRVVDEAAAPESSAGPVHVHCPIDLVSALLVDPIHAWMVARPKQPPIVHVPCAEDVAIQLLRGDLDVAIAFEPASVPGVTSALLCTFTNGVYASPDRGKQLRGVAPRALFNEAFVDYPVGALSFLRTMEDPDKQRVAYAPTMDVALQLASRGVGLVNVPDFVVRGRVKLQRLPCELPDGKLYLWSRRPVPGTLPAPMVAHLTGWPGFRELERPARRV